MTEAHRGRVPADSASNPPSDTKEYLTQGCAFGLNADLGGTAQRCDNSMRRSPSVGRKKRRSFHLIDLFLR